MTNIEILDPNCAEMLLVIKYLCRPCSCTSRSDCMRRRVCMRFVMVETKDEKVKKAKMMTQIE